MRVVAQARWLLLALALVSPTSLAASGELSLLAQVTQGDYGTGFDADTQQLTARYVTGQTWTIRAELAWLRVRTAPGVLRSALGPWRLGRGAGAGTGNAGQGGGSGGSGSGAGSGGRPHAPVGDWVSGVGDLLVATARTVAGGGARQFRLDARAQVKAPLADEDEGLGTGEWDARAGLSGEYRFWSVTLFGGAGWNRLGDPAGVELEDVIDSYCGLEGLAFGERVVLTGWIDGHQEPIDGIGEVAVVGFEVRGAQRRRWRAAITAGLGPAAEDFGVTVGRSFVFGEDGLAYREMLR